MSQGQLFRQAVINEKPLQIPGIINAYSAIMAAKVGFKALYLSGGGVANNSYGIPDTGVTTLDNVLIDAKRITDATELPLLVDIDTGFDDIAKTIKQMIAANVAAVHIEDQIDAKRCGHLDGKQLVSEQEMVVRIKACVDARTDESFVIIARTDAYAIEGLDATFARASAYKEAGADMLFIEALPDVNLYNQFIKIGLPLLANMTEFGKTPLYNVSELAAHGVDMILYPRSIDRVMSKAGLKTMQTILRTGSQQDCLQQMQTRKELYTFLDYL